MSENSPTPPPSDIPAAPPYPGYAAQTPTPQYPQQQYTGGYTPYPAAPKTNVLAIVSLVSSIAGMVVVYFIGSIVGIITGHIALKQIKEKGEGGRGLALSGLIVGYVGLGLAVIGTIALVAFLGLIAAGGAYTYNS